MEIFTHNYAILLFYYPKKPRNINKEDFHWKI